MLILFCAFFFLACRSDNAAEEAHEFLQQKLNEANKPFEKNDSLYPVLNLDSVALHAQPGDSFPLKQMVFSYDSSDSEK